MPERFGGELLTMGRYNNLLRTFTRLYLNYTSKRPVLQECVGVGYLSTMGVVEPVVQNVYLKSTSSLYCCWEMLISISHSKQLLVCILLSATRERAALLAVTSSDLNTDR